MPRESASCAVAPRAAAEEARIEHQLRAARAKLAGIEERLAAVRRITGGAALAEADAPVEGVTAEGGGSPVRGAKIREIAVRILLTSPDADAPIHYRRWLELLEEAGYSVLGKRPEAVFLGQLVRSPVLNETSRPGYYELDRRAPIDFGRASAGWRRSAWRPRLLQQRRCPRGGHRTPGGADQGASTGTARTAGGGRVGRGRPRDEDRRVVRSVDRSQIPSPSRRALSHVGDQRAGRRREGVPRTGSGASGGSATRSVERRTGPSTRISTSPSRPLTAFQGRAFMP